MTKQTARYDPRRYCRQPDRDEPRMTCGYPLPCPYHTLVIEYKGDDDLAKKLDVIHKVVAAKRGKP